MNFCIAGYLRIKSSPNNAIWFIKTNFLEAIKYFRLSIGAIVLRSSYPCGISKLKKVTWMPKRRQRVWIMKLLLYIWPIKTTKKALWCFARLTINSVSGCFRRFSGKFLKQTERLKRHSPIFLVFLVGNFQAEVRISCLQTFFEYQFQAFAAVFH